jgi:hypothetical protein
MIRNGHYTLSANTRQQQKLPDNGLFTDQRAER